MKRINLWVDESDLKALRQILLVRDQSFSAWVREVIIKELKRVEKKSIA